MSNAAARELMNFAPKEYYETVMEYYGVDLERWPWMKMDYDPSSGKRVMFAVYNFECPSIDGWPVAVMLVTYKSISSKSYHKCTIYLDNMSPACQVPPPYRYRAEGE